MRARLQDLWLSLLVHSPVGGVSCPLVQSATAFAVLLDCVLYQSLQFNERANPALVFVASLGPAARVNMLVRPRHILVTHHSLYERRRPEIPRLIVTTSTDRKNRSQFFCKNPVVRIFLPANRF